MASPQESNSKSSNNPSDQQTGGGFAAHYQRSYGKLTSVAAAILGRQEGAEDVVQHAIAIAIAKGNEFETEGGFLAWMVSIVRGCALNQRRKLYRRRTFSTDPVSLATFQANGSTPQALPINPASGELLADQVAFEDQLLEVLQELSGEARCCLLLRTVQELSYSEIAELLQIPQGTAMSHVHRSRQLLRKRLMKKKPV
jgi:RNA polymerase sigma-70 factor, ECF subfamily